MTLPPIGTILPVIAAHGHFHAFVPRPTGELGQVTG